jgi:hypothetical protein
MEGRMTQTAKMISRRSVTTGLAAAVAALPAVGLARAVPADDKLLRVISRYRAEIASLADEKIDAWVDRPDAILTEAAGLPVLTTASAVAVISLFVDDPALVQHCVYGDGVRALVEDARDYIASTA